MNPTYFRPSQYSVSEVISNIRSYAEEHGWYWVGQVDIPEGAIVSVCDLQWLEAISQSEPQLLGFVPCSIVVRTKGNKTVVGIARPAMLRALSQDAAIHQVSAKMEQQLKDLVHTAAGISEIQPKKVIVYSTTTCPYCKLEKTWLEENGIAHEVKLVDLNPVAAQWMVEKTGQMGVPVTEIQYKDIEPEFIIGFDRPQLTQALGIKAQQELA
ncbi:MAG: glutaredoxin domain-containing protein [Patescibacteria group bacterium]|nr:glutaredoxin domain-containing protein [Patescibacteria group bacterium]